MENTIVKTKAPYIRKPVSVMKMLIDVLIAIFPITVFSIFYGGWQTAIMFLISDVIMVGSEIIYLMIVALPKKGKAAFEKFGLYNILAPLISSHIFILMMPPMDIASGWYVVVVSSLFGIIVGKLVFGGFGSNIFNPAAVSRIFAAICFQGQLNQAFDATTGGTPLGALSESLININNFNLLDLFLGFNPTTLQFVQGAVGETCALLIIVGAVYLFASRSADLRIVLSTLITFITLIAFAGIALRINNKSLDVFKFIGYHLLSGGILFGTAFMSVDPVTSPNTKVGRIAFGSLIAIITVLIRLFGAFPEGMAFSILIGNACTPLLDSPKLASNKYRWWHPLIWVGVVGLIVGLFFIVLPGYVRG